MKYYVVLLGQEDTYRVRINDRAAIFCIQVLEPTDSFVLPESVINIAGILTVVPDIEGLPKIDESEITWMSEDEPNQLPT